MIEDPQRILTRIKDTLPPIASDAQWLGTTELLYKTPEIEMVEGDIDSLLARDDVGSLQLKIGRRAMVAIIFTIEGQKPVATTHELVKPGVVYDLREKVAGPSQTFDPELRENAYYGFTHFFDISTIAQTLEDGGELELVTLDSS